MHFQASLQLFRQKPVMTLCAALAGAIVVYAFCLSIYRLYLHPFAKYPGPWPGKLTSWWGSYLAYRGDIHIQIKMYHDKYGNIVRFSPNRLLFNTNTAFQQIYKSREVRKAEVYKTTIADHATPHLANAINPVYHARKNRQMRQTMHPQKLLAYESVWMKHIDELIDSLASKNSDSGNVWSPPRDVRVYSDRMMVDIMGKIGFGRELNCQTKQQHDNLPDFLVSSQKWKSVNIQSRSVASFRLGQILYPQQVFLKRQGWNEFEKIVQNRLRNKSSPSTDMFTDMIDLQVRENGDTNILLNELWVDSVVLVAGLTDQVGTTVSSTLFYLSRNPKAYARVVNEVRSVFQTSEQIMSGAAMDSCLYLQAVIKEALRMSPTIGAAPWREVISDTLQVDHEVIPRGYDVGVGMYSLHHNEVYFPHSYSFKPERWLGEDPFVNLSIAEDAWSAFSTGPRSCVAQHLSWMELKDIIAKLVWTLDLRVPSDPKLASIGCGTAGNRAGRHRPDEFQMKMHLTGTYDGPWLEFRRRDHA